MDSLLQGWRWQALLLGSMAFFGSCTIEGEATTPGADGGISDASRDAGSGSDASSSDANSIDASSGDAGSGDASGGGGGSDAGQDASRGQDADAGEPAQSTLPGDIAKAAGTPLVVAHSLTRAMFASYAGPLFKALRTSDNQEKDIGVAAAGGLVDASALSTFCSGKTCKITTLYDQSGNGNDLWRGDVSSNQPGTPIPCDLMDIQYWQMSDGTKIPIAVEDGQRPTGNGKCLRNRNKTKNMPTGSQPQTEWGVFHAKYVNGGCCFNYGNTGNAIHYSGPGTLSALNFSKESWWSKGQGDGPWVMVDWEAGVYAGDTCVCSHGALCGDCSDTGESTDPSVPYDVVTALMKHDGTAHWQLKSGNAKSGALSVGLDLPTLPKGYSPLRQEGGLTLGEGGAGDNGGAGGFSEGAVIAAETSDATDDAIQKSIVSVYGK